MKTKYRLVAIGRKKPINLDFEGGYFGFSNRGKVAVNLIRFKAILPI